MQRLSEQFWQQWPPSRWQTRRIVVACSGGPDSTALARLLVERHVAPQRLILAHYHHGLRGQDADEDALFVEQLAAQLGTQLAVEKASAKQLQQAASGEGIESAARKLRYDFLIRTAKQSAARYIATGHTADDQVETVLYQVIRGSGLAGLAGIAAFRAMDEALTLVRPLLAFRRHELVHFLRQLQQPSRHDPHNDQLHFRRNRIRHELLPWLEDHLQPAVRQSLTTLSRIAADAQQFIRHEAERLADQSVLAWRGQQVSLDPTPIRQAHVHLRRELFVCIWQRQAWPLQAMRFDHWQQLAMAAVHPDTAKRGMDFPGAIRVIWSVDRIVLERVAPHSGFPSSENLH